MLFSRLRPGRKPPAKPKVEKIKELDEFLEIRDYVGAITLLEHKQKSENDMQNNLWLGYCAYHAGEYQKAASVYEVMLKQKDCPTDVNLYLACCYMMLGMNEEARKLAEKQPKSEFQNRILLHLANKAGDTKKTMYHHSLLTSSINDQMSYAAINFSRGHYAEPMMTYKQLINEQSTFLALNVYLGLCYYKMEYFEEAIQCANAYLEKYPDSPTAINLQAACLFRTASPKLADQHLKKLKHVAESELSFAKDLILHNSVVFKNGEAALQVLPALVDVVPEARRNLVVYYLKKNDVDAAFGVANGLTMKTPTDYLLKALVYIMLGFERRQQPNVERAAQYFKAVGESKEEENTIIGRLSMAAYFFANKEYQQALTYYNSIIQFNNDDDSFNFNYGQTTLFTENYDLAAEALGRVKDERLIATSVYQLGYTRALVRSHQPEKAWAFYTAHQQSTHWLFILKLIANDCYQLEEYLYAAMAFDALSRRDSRNEYSAAKQGACIGVVKLFTIQKADKEQVATALHILEQDTDPKSANLVAMARKWMTESTLIAAS